MGRKIVGQNYVWALILSLKSSNDNTQTPLLLYKYSNYDFLLDKKLGLVKNKFDNFGVSIWLWF